MDRTRSDGICPACRKIPAVDKNGARSCACSGVLWQGMIGVPGRPEKRELLERHCFQETTDIRGDVYYVGPVGHIVWLHLDGTWFSDKAPADYISLQEYLAWVTRLAAAL